MYKIKSCSKALVIPSFLYLPQKYKLKSVNLLDDDQDDNASEVDDELVS